ncbi:polysaccharide deacetylase family protein [Candidatus Altiarchaeota archaeon]
MSKDESGRACITLDLEQDLPQAVTGSSYESLSEIEFLKDIITRHGLRVTAFTTGYLIENKPDLIDSLSEVGVEFALHSYSHEVGNDMGREVEHAVNAYEDRFGRRPVGYRAPLGIIDDAGLEILARHGFKYDSSIFPSIFPGRYMNLKYPKTPFMHEEYGIMELPVSVTPYIPLPISLSYMKLLGYNTYSMLLRNKLPDPLIFDFHMHDLSYNSAHERLPFKWRLIYGRNKYAGKPMLEKFIGLLRSRGYSFCHMKELI